MEWFFPYIGFQCMDSFLALCADFAKVAAANNNYLQKSIYSLLITTLRSTTSAEHKCY
jgi:hypothetical protein